MIANLICVTAFTPDFIPVFDRSGRENIGDALESTVLVELLRRGAEVTWVKTPKGSEIDFLARFPGGGTELIQVAAQLTDAATVEREQRALEDARSDFKDARLRLLTLNQDRGIPGAEESGIEVTPAYEWILSTQAIRCDPYPTVPKHDCYAGENGTLLSASNSAATSSRPAPNLSSKIYRRMDCRCSLILLEITRK